jgi:phosphotransacetylase
MKARTGSLQHMIDQARINNPIRLAVVGAGRGLVLDGLQQAKALGLVEPCLIGNASEIADLAKQHGWDPAVTCIAAGDGDTEAAAIAARLVRDMRVDAIMKGNIHTDVLMRALLSEASGLRVPGRRASHVFVIEVPTYPKLLVITDAAVNISPDLKAKAQILQNAIEVARAIGVVKPKAAVLSAIASTIDAAALTVMSQRGQISGALVDGPLAFDNVVSAAAAKEKGVVSEVAGDADIILVPDLVSGNILVKNLEYLAGATLAGAVVGLAAPVVLTSRADPSAARVASIALATLIHKSNAIKPAVSSPEAESTVHAAPQLEAACHPLPA